MSVAVTPHRAAFATRNRRYFDILVALFCVVLILSNVGASKGVLIGPVFGDFTIVTDGGFFLFPLAYVLGDVLSEVYGFAAARRTVVTGFALSLLASLAFVVIIALPGFTDAYGTAKQSALEGALGQVPQIVIASMAGYVVGQLLNSWVLVRLKERTGESALWGRLIGSTGVGEFADTLIFCSIAAPVIGIADAGQFVNYVIAGYLYKCLVEIVVSPLTMLVIRVIKSREPDYATPPAA
ncbi:hypothetical protein BKD30_11680 [Tersicoccus phoenicis]|uniref:Probable queuosine precursor transporter n=1 Tax=Tersicoccus phoenicis TaxID=554083 RepID=A0A1R1L7Q4_9MICC|nr:queuosine precursor transporter [Tersicoccus phoenicis]OMH23572.1 hypothetical protein BKD30_11680 [Tersicoccus phoenicis]